MNPKDYQFAAQVFADACQQPADQRSRFVQEACRQRPDLRPRIEAMLAADAAEVHATLSADGDMSGGQPGRTSPWEPGQAEAAAETPRFAGYELLEEIGRGGMGVVYRARQRQPRRTVALKMIRAGRFASAADVERFHTEAEATANLEHEGIAPIYEVGEQDGEHFFSMKFVDGPNLAQRLEPGDLPLRETLELLKSVCDAVAHAHQQGIVHRDLKPSNVLIDRRGRPWVTDFGLAKYLDRESSLTSAGDVMGTPGYMSPEQAAGQADRVTAASDVYSLGAMLYQILTGRRPIELDTADRMNLLGMLQRIQQEEIAAPHTRNRRVPRDLETICMKCLERDPAMRYPTARELADDLGRYLEGEPILAKPVSWVRRAARWARRQPGLATTWIAVAGFYAYQLTCYYVLRLPEITATYHYASTAVAAAWSFGAWAFQRLLNRSHGRPVYVFLWVTMEIALVTLLLFATNGPKSAMTLIYHVLVAGVVLRGRTDLVGYATVLALAGYWSHVLCAIGHRPALVPSLMEVVPFTISLTIIGLIQYLALRRCRAGTEASRGGES